MGLKVETIASGGGCDANIFNKRGIECANLGTGMRAIHTVKEWLDVKDMYASANMTLEIMRLNALRLLETGSGGPLQKLHWSHWHQRLGELALDVLGPAAAVADEAGSGTISSVMDRVCHRRVNSG